MFVDIEICVVLEITEQKKEDHQSYVSSYHYASIKMEINDMGSDGQQHTSHKNH